MSGRPTRKYITYAFVTGAVILILLWFFLDYYEVYSSSMLPGLRPGDYIIVERLTFHRRPIERKGSTAITFIEFGCVKRGDVIVFHKPLWQFNPTDLRFYGEEYVKRCYGVPGDSVVIDQPPLQTGYVPKLLEPAWRQVFTQDSSVKWSINKLGPLWVPRQGRSVVLDAYTLKIYRSILQSEGFPFPASIETFVRKRKEERTYIFKYDYYFFLGDNFYESEDSRRWGFVPRFNLLGKMIVKI